MRYRKRTKKELKTIEERILYNMNGLCDLSEAEQEIASFVYRAAQLMQMKYFIKVKAVQKLSEETGRSLSHCYNYFKMAEYIIAETSTIDKKAMRTIMHREHIREIKSLEKRRKYAAANIADPKNAIYIEYSKLIHKHLESIEKLFSLDKKDKEEDIIPPELYDLPGIAFTSDVKALEINKQSIEEAEEADETAEQ